MKIGIVTEYCYPLLGGISENVHNTRTRLEKLGYEIKVITSDSRRSPFALRGDGEADDPAVIRIGRSIPLFSNGSFAHLTVGMRLREKLNRVIESEGFDLLHLHSPIVPTLPLLALLDAKIGLVGTFHTYFERNLACNLFKHNVQKLMDKIDRQIAVSETTVRALERYFRVKARVIPNGVDTDAFTPGAQRMARFDDGKSNLLFLSRFDPRNGLRFMLRAFDLVKSQYPDVRLIVVGDGPLSPYYRRFVPKHLASDVHFEGRNKDERTKYYASCDLFCSPVMKASFGITLLEAMASGKPIVATENEGYRELMGSDEGVLIPRDEPTAFAGAIVELLKDDAARKEMGASGRRKALRYSWDRVSSEIDACYRELLGGR